MTATTAPAPVYTVWDRERYVASTEVFTGEDFATALQIAVDRLADAVTVRPLDPTHTAALQAAGKPVNAWLAVDADGGERIVFITR